MATYRVGVPVEIFRDGDRFVAYSEVLNLSASGLTKTKAKERFKKALDGVIEDFAEWKREKLASKIPIELSQTLTSYDNGEWVALARSVIPRVLGHGKTIDEALTMAKENEEPPPYLMRIPNEGETKFLLI